MFDTTHHGKGVDVWGNARIALRATTSVNRKDFGLHWDMALEARGLLVGDRVKIDIEAEAVWTA